MSRQPLALAATGIVSSVGLSAPAACAAIRSGLTNPTQTRYLDGSADWLMSHCVPLEKPWRGREKLLRMAAMAAEECLAQWQVEKSESIPLLLCVAERARPGRLDRIEAELLADLQQALGLRFAPESCVLPHGRVSAPIALSLARRLVYESGAPAALIVATDSLMLWPTLKTCIEQGRLLTQRNSNGFIAGEAAAALLVTQSLPQPHLSIEGVGFAEEAAHIDSQLPLRADGLSEAIKAALADAGTQMHEIDFRIVDASGEQYYFKEAALALSRVLRVRKQEFDIWHPAECVGETGSAIGPIMLAVADTACRKGYAPGMSILSHAASDAGQRAAVVCRFVER
jgi:3-oxoacyl-[acyl-carrier-protein] synthase-1